MQQIKALLQARVCGHTYLANNTACCSYLSQTGQAAATCWPEQFAYQPPPVLSMFKCVCVCALQVPDPDTRQFLMFYEAVAADGSRSIGLATSKDGRSSWQRQAEPLLGPSQQAGAWDAGSVGAPCAVAMSAGRWRLYYSGRSQQLGPWEGIGVALGGPAGEGAAAGGQLAFQRRTGRKAGQPEQSA